MTSSNLQSPPKFVLILLSLSGKGLRSKRWCFLVIVSAVRQPFSLILTLLARWNRTMNWTVALIPHHEAGYFKPSKMLVLNSFNLIRLI